VLLVVGLGNPGSRYAGTRHNVGFMVVERVAARTRAGAFREKFQGLFTKAELDGREVVLLEPLTYMNLSGESVQKAMTFFKVPLKDVVVVHDELDLAWRTSRIKVGGGHAGHNGLRSIMQQCGGPDFTRVRVGIGRPRSGPVDGYVLSDFDTAERAELDGELEKAARMVESIVARGPQAAMNELHREEKAPKA
jgi:PTH1 family peptidyl-tRNA hydrolase